MRKSFTLPEILITLAVIGIVAALTIPVLYNKIQHKILLSQFKKAYANIVEAYKITTEEDGIEYECYLDNGTYKTSQCNEFYQAFFSRQKANNSCTYGDTTCAPIYKSYGKIVADKENIYQSSCSYAAPSTALGVYQLPNGIIYIRSKEGGNGYNFFILDINGKKGPNKYGFDVFYLTFVKDNTKDYRPVKPDAQLCAAKEKGGYTFQQMLKEIGK